MADNRPPFALEAQDPPRMNERLSDFSDLVGETILAAFDNNDDGEFVLVTENRNWIVLQGDIDGCGGDAAPYIQVAHPPAWRPETQTLADFVHPRDLHAAGVINAAVFQELQAKRDEAEKVERERKANRLRQQLTELEKGAI